MAKYFSITELTHSSTADARGIDNSPTPDVIINLNNLMDNLLDPIREVWGKPLRVNSGYRCPVLNAAVGGSPTSQHAKGEAADIEAGTNAENKALFGLIEQMQTEGKISFGQLIWEKGDRNIGPDWVHVSTGTKNQVLYL